MKTFNALTFAIALGLIQPLASYADDLFAISWRETVHSGTTTRSYTEKDVVNTIAINNGLDPKDLVLVYRPNAFDTAVVNKNTGAVIADFVQLPDITRVGTSWVTDVTVNGQTVRQAFIFDEQTNPIGSIYGTEKQKRDASGAIISESYHGTFQIAIPDDSHLLGQGVYSGTFATGRRIKDTTGN